MKIQKVISSLPVRLKSGVTVPFGKVISPQQLAVVAALESHDRVAVVKARQIGVSTVARAWALCDVLRKPGATHMLVSNKQRSSRELMRIDARMASGLTNLVGSDVVDKATADAISWANGSRTLCFSGAASNDRGYTVDSLHISEYAHVDHGDDILATILPSMAPKGKVLLESTPSHYGDPLHDLVTNSQDNDRWKVLFFPWFSFADYHSGVPTDFILTSEEKELIGLHGISPPQLAWRRMKIGEYAGDEVRFRREYPSTLHEAYSLAEGSWLSDAIVSAIVPGHFTTAMENDGIKVWTNPTHQRDNRRRYCIGFDPAGGTGGDYAVMFVLDRSGMEIVQIIASNTCPVERMAERCVQAYSHWHNAPILFEQNNHGHAVDVVLRRANANAQSWTTTAPSKVQLFEKLRDHLHKGVIKGIDSETIGELRTLRRKEGLAPAAASGHHDDRPVALALCLMMHSQLPSVPVPDWRR